MAKKHVSAGVSLFDVDKVVSVERAKATAEERLVLSFCQIFKVPTSVRRDIRSNGEGYTFSRLWDVLDSYNVSYPEFFKLFEVYYLKESQKKLFSLPNLLRGNSTFKAWSPVLTGETIGLFPNVFTGREGDNGIVCTLISFSDFSIWELSGAYLKLAVTPQLLNACGIGGPIDITPNTYLTVFYYDQFLKLLCHATGGDLFSVGD